MRTNGMQKSHGAFLVAAFVGAIGGCGDPVEEELGGEETESVPDDLGLSASELTSIAVGNPGFESDWSGWVRVGATGLTTVTHSGAKAAKVMSGGGQVKRDVTGLKPATQYVLSAYVKGYARIGVRSFNGTSTVSKPINATSYSKVSVTFTTGATNTSAQIFASWVSGGDARVDDFSLAQTSSTTTTATSTTCTYPSQLLDLGAWKLQLPLGSPTVEVKLPTLASYVKSPYFRANSTCTGVRFRAHTSGTTTSGSEYPRSELREMTADGAEKAAWSTTSGTHRMYLDQAVTSLPRGKRHLAVGQVHNGDNDIIMIRVEGNVLKVKPNGSSAFILDSSYTLGKRFQIEFVARGGAIEVYYNRSSSPVFTHKRSTSTAYFKAGAYTQSNCETEAEHGETCGTDNYGEVVIHDLRMRHD
jgi:hypothetical protein